MYDRGTIVRVTWVDATHFTGELSGDEKVAIDRACIGFVVRHDDDGILMSMARSVVEEGEVEFDMGFGIPTPYITSIVALEGVPYATDAR